MRYGRTCAYYARAGRKRDVNFSWRNAFAGSAVGAVNGLLGGGGGMVAVPVLAGTGMGVRQAHATAIAVILPASLASALVYLIYGLLPFAYFVPVAVGTVLGGFLGANVLNNAPSKTVTIAFAALMLAAGLKTVIG